MGLEVIIGNFIGAVLAQCAPVLVGILSEAIKRANTDTVEDGEKDVALRERLLKRISDSKLRSQNNNPSSG